VQKTDHLLRDALMSLIHDKSYDSIVVKEILDRANVGRSTFYTHFRDKDDLLVSAIHDALQSMRPAARAGAADRVVWFGLPILEHIDRHRREGKGTMTVASRAALHDRLERVIVDLIADDVRERFAGQKTPGRLPPELLVRYIASTFILVLSWWLESASALAPKDVDRIVRALILPAVADG